VEKSLQLYDLFILPSKSENFGHSIFEALSAGKPVITSHFTPFNDLNNHCAGANVSVDNISEMTKSINFFAAMSQEEFIKWNIGARQYASTRIDKQALNHQYDQLFFNNSIFNT
jgi:glycosyltransferase involved in cell wall biosynthesis